MEWETFLGLNSVISVEQHRVSVWRNEDGGRGESGNCVLEVSWTSRTDLAALASSTEF